MSDALRSTVVSLGCLVRRVPLFFRASPRTPLRALGIIALETLSVLRRSQRLPERKVRELALFLDFEGCINARWDQKPQPPGECEAIRHQLERAGYVEWIETYLDRLRRLESGRPQVGGDGLRFDEVRTYREGVARLALTTAAAIALNTERPNDDVDTLFRILMQCQIIDDVLDYTGDIAAGLPSFLTASASLPQALALTADAVWDYGHPPTQAGIFPIRMALVLVTAMTSLVLMLAPRLHLGTRQVVHR